MSDRPPPSLRRRRAAARCVTLLLAVGLASMIGLAQAAGQSGTDDGSQPGGGAGNPNEAEPLRPRPDVDDGRQLYLRDCASCHGPRGDGTARGPTLRSSGTAFVDYMISTGRMPIRHSDQQIKRKRPLYDEDEIRNIIDYVESFTVGPEVREVAPKDELVALGGELFRIHCAACHQFVGTGGVLVGMKQAPTLHHSSPTIVRNAIRVGPSTMPQFTDDVLSEREVTAIATYVADVVQAPEDVGGLALAHWGPFSEGFVTWFGGIGALLGVAWWIGSRT